MKKKNSRITGSKKGRRQDGESLTRGKMKDKGEGMKRQGGKEAEGNKRVYMHKSYFFFSFVFTVNILIRICTFCR